MLKNKISKKYIDYIFDIKFSFTLLAAFLFTFLEVIQEIYIILPGGVNNNNKYNNILMFLIMYLII